MRNTKWTKAYAVIIPAALLVLSVTGCGNAQPATNSNTANSTATKSTNSTSNDVVVKNSNGGETLIQGAGSLAGKANLQKYEHAAKSSPKNAKAQMMAAESAHVNGNDTLAIQYYKKVIAIDPKNGTAFTAIGNIYLRDKSDPKSALPYYQKATSVDPTYGYGWYNLAYTEQKLGNKAAAARAKQEGLAKVPKTDPAYSMIKQLS